MVFFSDIILVLILLFPTKVASETPRGSGRFKAIDMDFILTGLTFNSYPGKFRIYSKMTNEGLELKLEKLKSQHQWYTNVTDVSQHGEPGLPNAVVFSVMKNALQSIAEMTGASSLDHERSDGIIDVLAGDSGQIYFHLDGSLACIPISYVFEMIPVVRESIDVLESLLHDVQDENAELLDRIIQLEAIQAADLPVLISLRSSTPIMNSYVKWDLLEQNTDKDCFEQTSNQQSITVKRKGFYQISVRLTDNSYSSPRTISVRINGKDLAVAYSGHSSGLSNSIILHDVFFLKTDSTVDVYSNGNSAQSGDPLSNSLTIIKL